MSSFERTCTDCVPTDIIESKPEFFKDGEVNLFEDHLYPLSPSDFDYPERKEVPKNMDLSKLPKATQEDIAQNEERLTRFVLSDLEKETGIKFYINLDWVYLHSSRIVIPEEKEKLCTRVLGSFKSHLDRVARCFKLAKENAPNNDIRFFLAQFLKACYQNFHDLFGGRFR